MKLVFWPTAWEDYLYWQNEDARELARQNALLKQCLRDPFSGRGKPEPLGGHLSGWWSRRINREHRLVYRVSGKGETQVLQVAQCGIIIESVSGECVLTESKTFQRFLVFFNQRQWVIQAVEKSLRIVTVPCVQF